MTGLSRIIRFGQRCVVGFTQMRAAGLVVREDDSVLILSAQSVWGAGIEMTIADALDVRDEGDRRFDASSWGARYEEPVSWFFVRLPRFPTRSRRLRITVTALACVRARRAPRVLSRSEYAPYTPSMSALPETRVITGPWSFDVPLRRRRIRRGAMP